VKNRSGQRVARFRIYMGKFTQGKKFLTVSKLIKERGELRQIDSHLQILKVGA